jgi:glycosyltransferase involved in cell wall biosynthesis
MHIAIFNWRDVNHPQAGGAEVVTYEVAHRWAADGHRVTWLAASFPGAPTRETLDGVEIVRQGRQYTVHWHAWRFYRRELRGRVDVVIDQVNTIPFFTPLYVRERLFVWAHQLAREVWWHEARFPFSLLGYLAEPLYWQVYRHTPALVGAESIERDLRRLGLRRFVRFSYGVGVDPLPDPPSRAPGPPTVLYVGRLVPSKRVDAVVEAAAHARRRVPDLRLLIAGGGEPGYSTQLEKLAARLGLEGCVTFAGRVSDEEKRRLMREADALALASVREGWGLVVIEANALGTPAVVYDVPGLRDSVQDGQTGLICHPNTPEALGDALADLLSDPARLAVTSAAAWAYSKAFTWARNAQEMMQGIEACR